jgi:hypothetical protein
MSPRIIEERNTTLVIFDEGDVKTVPKTPYHILKFKDFHGNRITYRFSKDMAVQERKGGGVFDCTYGDQLVVISDVDEMALAIQQHAKENSNEKFRELFSAAWSENNQDVVVSWFLQNYITTNRLVHRGSKYIVDDVFTVDSDGVTCAVEKRYPKEDRWLVISLPIKGQLSPKEMSVNKVPTLVDKITQEIIAKILFLLDPDVTDTGFMVQLPAKLRRWIYRGDRRAAINWPTSKISKDEGIHVPKGIGYFPTPKNVVLQLIDAAELEDGMSILEPSAGQGNILDLLNGDYKITCGELFLGNRKILEEKGYKVEFDDFMEFVTAYKFDRVIMNPPFEHQADIDHVLHAFSMLQKGGKLVSIMSRSVLHRENKKTVQFREFLEKHGYWLELPEDSFKESGTGVHTVIVVMHNV